MTTLRFALFTASAAGSAAVGGVFFAFSSFVMPALGQMPGQGGFLAMKQINETVLSSSLLPLMFGTMALLLACLFVLPPAGTWARSFAVAAILLYCIGSIGITVVFNVPLNNRLADAAISDLAFWRTYLDQWTGWNSVRAVASIAAGASLIVALVQAQRT